MKLEPFDSLNKLPVPPPGWDKNTNHVFLIFHRKGMNEGLYCGIREWWSDGDGAEMVKG